MTRGINDLAPSIEVPFGSTEGDAVPIHEMVGMAVHHRGDITVRRVGRVTVTNMPRSP